MSIYSTRDIEQYTNSLAQYLPNDRLFEGKNVQDHELRELLKGLAFTVFDANGYIKEFVDDISPEVTQKFLAEWERALGIPDDCFTVTGQSKQRRRMQIIAKLSYMACQTSDDIIALGALFGYTITVVPGIEDISGITAGLTDTEKRFTIVINTNLSNTNSFPLTFPITFGSSEAPFLECVVRKVIPSNCQALFNHTG